MLSGARLLDQSLNELRTKLLEYANYNSSTTHSNSRSTSPRKNTHPLAQFACDTRIKTIPQFMARLASIENPPSGTLAHLLREMRQHIVHCLIQPRYDSNLFHQEILQSNESIKSILEVLSILEPDQQEAVLLSLDAHGNNILTAIINKSSNALPYLLNTVTALDADRRDKILSKLLLRVTVSGYNAFVIAARKTPHHIPLLLASLHIIENKEKADEIFYRLLTQKTIHDDMAIFIILNSLAQDTRYRHHIERLRNAINDLNNTEFRTHILSCKNKSNETVNEVINKILSQTNVNTDEYVAAPIWHNQHAEYTDDIDLHVIHAAGMANGPTTYMAPDIQENIMPIIADLLDKTLKDTRKKLRKYSGNTLSRSTISRQDKDIKVIVARIAKNADITTVSQMMAHLLSIENPPPALVQLIQDIRGDIFHKIITQVRNRNALHRVIRYDFAHARPLFDLISVLDQMQKQDLLTSCTAFNNNPFMLAVCHEPCALLFLREILFTLEPEQRQYVISQWVLQVSTEADARGANAFIAAIINHPELVPSLFDLVNTIQPKSMRDEIVYQMFTQSSAQQGYTALMFAVIDHRTNIQLITDLLDMINSLDNPEYKEAIMSYVSMKQSTALRMLETICERDGVSSEPIRTMFISMMDGIHSHSAHANTSQPMPSAVPVSSSSQQTPAATIQTNNQQRHDVRRRARTTRPVQSTPFSSSIFTPIPEESSLSERSLSRSMTEIMKAYEGGVGVTHYAADPSEKENSQPDDISSDSQSRQQPCSSMDYLHQQQNNRTPVRGGGPDDTPRRSGYRRR